MAMDLEFVNLEMVEYLKTHNIGLYNNVEWLYTICQNLLLEIPKTFSNYTIHDIKHSIRVIGYMNELIKNRLDDFSCLHIAILIYAGLLHDTGMVVSDEEKKKLYSEFEAKDTTFKAYTEEQKLSALQDYIRRNHGRRVREVLEQPIDPDGTKIKSRLRTGDTHAYDLTKIVADICQSHMEETEWLATHLDDDLTYGHDSFNPRHAAVLLRIGDALDIDDRRAPFVLYQILKIKGYSSTEWQKHIPITNYDKILHDGKEFYIHFEGKSNDYDIYQKVDKYIDDVESWLIKDLPLCTGKYALNIRPSIEKNIKSDEFVITPLSFTLDYERITKLLMGEKIYGHKRDGLRELLQNAIDAVLLMKSIDERKNHSSYIPKIGIEIREKDRQICVFDTGVGMSESILEKFFFNIGRSFYESNEFSNTGSLYSPIGHFGIGFLACFMLSSSITLETKHYSDGSKAIKMKFDKESHNIIRYKKKPKFDFEHGTRIIMDYDQIIPDVFADIKDIKHYIEDLLLDNGYHFIFSTPANTEHELNLKKLSKLYTDKSKLDTVEYEYTLNTPSGILHDTESYFGEGTDVYIIDKELASTYDYEANNATNITSFMEECEELNAALQMKYDDPDIEDIIGKVAAESPDDIFSNFTLTHLFEIKDYFDKYYDIREYYMDYLTSFIDDNQLIWYEYPYVIDKNAYYKFEEAYKRMGASRALQDYASQIQYISVLSKGNEPDPDTVKDIIRQIYDDNYMVDESVQNPLLYQDKYPFEPIKRSKKILRNGDSPFFIVINENNHSYELKTYLKGIRVIDDTITLPYVIEGIDLQSIIVNFKSGRYELDVSRNSFDSKDKEEISKMISRAVYNEIKENKSFSKEEKELISLFLQVYYGD